MAYIFMTYTVMAYIIVAYIVGLYSHGQQAQRIFVILNDVHELENTSAFSVENRPTDSDFLQVCIVMAHIVMAYIVMALKVTAYIVMASVENPADRLRLCAGNCSISHIAMATYSSIRQHTPTRMHHACLCFFL